METGHPSTVVSQERFAQGMTYDEFKAGMTRNQDRFAENERILSLAAEDVAALAALPQPVNVLVLAEDWCGDVVDNLPVLGGLATASGKLTIRVFLRDKNLDVMDQYLKDGKFRSIPVFVFFDAAFHELGYFTERPESVTARRAASRRALSAQHPELGSPDVSIADLSEETRVLLKSLQAEDREREKPLDNQDVVNAIRAIVAPARA
jgi:hypothetical protein